MRGATRALALGILVWTALCLSSFLSWPVAAMAAATTGAGAGTVVRTGAAAGTTPAQAPAAAGAESGKGKSGLPLPRFVSLRSDEVNMRAGPGMRYPIEWVFRRQGLPVEVTAEYDIWFRVRDADGVQGWVQRGMISGRRMALIHGAMRNLLKDDEPSAPTVARLEIGATGKILSCKKDWCKLEFGNVRGFLRKSEFWGAYPNETIH